MTCFRAGGMHPRATTRAENALAQLVSEAAQFTIYSPLKFYASCKDKKVVNKMGGPTQPQRKRCGKRHLAWNLFSAFRALP